MSKKQDLENKSKLELTPGHDHETLCKVAVVPVNVAAIGVIDGGSDRCSTNEEDDERHGQSHEVGQDAKDDAASGNNGADAEVEG